LFVENGRIQDTPGRSLKSALASVVARFRPEVRLTPSQNLLLVDVRPEQQGALAAELERHGVSVANPFSKVRLASMACPALPTCGLSLAESERYLPGLLTRFEELLRELALLDQEITIRMTGCPNGCARPYTAELAFVGKAPGKYQVYVGGNVASNRLNRVYRESVKDAEMINELRPLLRRYGLERADGERFGDWCARVVWPELAAQS
jgi:sulfite reductase beta subunit-like hemoprotein